MLGLEVVPDHRNEDLVITAKAKSGRWIEDYDEKYQRQVKIVVDETEAVWAAWADYVTALAGVFPELMRTDKGAENDEE